jgi:hypothetical protein
MQSHTKRYFIQALQCSLQKHNLELFKDMGIVTGGALSMIASKNGMVLFFTSMNISNVLRITALSIKKT